METESKEIQFKLTPLCHTIVTVHLEARTCKCKEMECVMWYNKRQYIRKHGNWKQDGITRAPILYEWQPFTYLQVSSNNTFCLTFLLWKVKAIYKELSSIVACHLNRLFIIHCCPDDPSHLRKTGKVTSRDSGFDKQRPEFTCRIRPSYNPIKCSKI